MSENDKYKIKDFLNLLSVETQEHRSFDEGSNLFDDIPINELDCKNFENFESLKHLSYRDLSDRLLKLCKKNTKSVEFLNKLNKMCIPKKKTALLIFLIILLEKKLKTGSIENETNDKHFYSRIEQKTNCSEYIKAKEVENNINNIENIDCNNKAYYNINRSSKTQRQLFENVNKFIDEIRFILQGVDGKYVIFDDATLDCIIKNDVNILPSVHHIIKQISLIGNFYLQFHNILLQTDSLPSSNISRKFFCSNTKRFEMYDSIESNKFGNSDGVSKFNYEIEDKVEPIFLLYFTKLNKSRNCVVFDNVKNGLNQICNDYAELIQFQINNITEMSKTLKLDKINCEDDTKLKIVAEGNVFRYIMISLQPPFEILNCLIYILYSITNIDSISILETLYRFVNSNDNLLSQISNYLLDFALKPLILFIIDWVSLGTSNSTDKFFMRSIDSELSGYNSVLDIKSIPSFLRLTDIEIIYKLGIASFFMIQVKKYQNEFDSSYENYNTYLKNKYVDNSIPKFLNSEFFHTLNDQKFPKLNVNISLNNWSVLEDLIIEIITTSKSKIKELRDIILNHNQLIEFVNIISDLFLYRYPPFIDYLIECLTNLIIKNKNFIDTVTDAELEDIFLNCLKKTYEGSMNAYKNHFLVKNFKLIKLHDHNLFGNSLWDNFGLTLDLQNNPIKFLFGQTFTNLLTLTHNYIYKINRINKHLHSIWFAIGRNSFLLDFPEINRFMNRLHSIVNNMRAFYQKFVRYIFIECVGKFCDRIAEEITNFNGIDVYMLKNKIQFYQLELFCSSIFHKNPDLVSGNGKSFLNLYTNNDSEKFLDKTFLQAQKNFNVINKLLDIINDTGATVDTLHLEGYNFVKAKYGDKRITDVDHLSQQIETDASIFDENYNKYIDNLNDCYNNALKNFFDLVEAYESNFFF